MRGSVHDTGIREFTIDERGMHVGSRFKNVTGILAGHPVHLSPTDLEQAWLEHESSQSRRRGSRADPERRLGNERRK
jgi:hypothetical protein